MVNGKSALFGPAESHKFVRWSDRIQALPKLRSFQFIKKALRSARQPVARYSSKFSKRRYKLYQHFVLLYLKVRKNTTYRTLFNKLIEIPRTRRTDVLG